MTCLSRSVSRSSQIRFVMLTSASTTRSRIILWVRARGSEPSTYRHGRSPHRDSTEQPTHRDNTPTHRDGANASSVRSTHSLSLPAGPGRSGGRRRSLGGGPVGPAPPPRESRRPRGDRGARSRLAPRRRPSRGASRTASTSSNPPPRRRGRSTPDVAQVVGNVFGRGPTRALGVRRPPQ